MNSWILQVVRKTPKWAIAQTLALATLSGFAFYYPWLSIEQDFSFDPSNPFTQTFSITNEGFLPASNVRMFCIRTFDFGTNHMGSIGEGGETLVANEISYKGKASVPCNTRELMGFPKDDLKNATYTVTVRYEIGGGLKLKRLQHFSFQLAKDTQGQYHWLYGSE